MCGLTVCCAADGGAIGFGTHFHQYSEVGGHSSYSIWQGQHEGCIFHIRLKARERVTAVWMLFYNRGFCDYPYLRVSDPHMTRMRVDLRTECSNVFQLVPVPRSSLAKATPTHWLQNFRDQGSLSSWSRMKTVAPCLDSTMTTRQEHLRAWVASEYFVHHLWQHQRLHPNRRRCLFQTTTIYFINSKDPSGTTLVLRPLSRMSLTWRHAPSMVAAQA